MLALWAARRLRRPVKWTCERSEAFVSDYAGRDLINTAELADMQARIDLDAWYVAHQSIWLDLRILARTPLEVLSQRNAV